MGRHLMLLGAVVFVIGALWTFGPHLKIPFGNLPGDINFKKDGMQFSFPIVTCLILSLFVSLLLWVVRYFSK